MNDKLNDPVRLEALRESGLLTKSIPERIDHLAYAACRLLFADACQVNALDGRLQHTVSGYPPGDRLDVHNEDTGCRVPVLTGEPFAVKDATLNPITCVMPWVQEFRGYLGVPIFYSEQVVGAMCVLSFEVRAWRKYEVTAMEGMARLVGMSLEE